MSPPFVVELGNSKLYLAVVSQPRGGVNVRSATEGLRIGSLHPLARPQHEMHGAADEPQLVAEAILQITAVGEVQRLVGVGEEGERRRAGAQLGAVVEAARAAAHGRRLMGRDGALEDLIQLRGAEAQA